MDGWRREGKAFQKRRMKVIINDNKGDDLMGSLHRELMRLVLQGSPNLWVGWAEREAEFTTTSACTRCKGCIYACC